jgi:hypothetical protein
MKYKNRSSGVQEFSRDATGTHRLNAGEGSGIGCSLTGWRGSLAIQPLIYRVFTVGKKGRREVIQ